MRSVEHLENLPVPKPPDQEMQSSSNADEHSSDKYMESNDPETRINQYHFLKRL